MKIDNSNNNLVHQSLTESNNRAAATKLAEQTQSQSVPSGVSVTLGSASSQLRSLEGSGNELPPMDAKKIAEIKQAISEGRFQINAAAIADGLMNDVEELVNADGQA